MRGHGGDERPDRDKVESLGNMPSPSPRVFIVVPVYNRVATTCNFLALISEQSYPSITVVLVDDCSTDNTVQVVQERFGRLVDLVLVRTKGDAWWGGCVHRGLEEVLKRANDADCALLMNDDVAFDTELVAGLVEAHRRSPSAVLAALPVLDGRVHGPGSNMLCWPLALTSRPYEGRELSSTKLPELIPVQFQFAHATLYPLIVLKTIGNVACRALPHYHADGELSYRAVRHGFPSFVVTSVRVLCDPHSTGLFNFFHNDHNWKDLIPSFFRFKSINNVRHRWQFARLCSPAIWRYPYFVSHVLKSLIRSIAILLLGDKSIPLKVKKENRA